MSDERFPTQPQIRENSMVITLKRLVKAQNELKALYSAMGMTWEVDSHEDAMAVLGALMESYGGSE